MKIVENKKFWFIISLTIIIIGLGLMMVRGLNYDIEFAGGTMMHVHIGQEFTEGDIRTVVEDVLGSKAEGADIQKVSGSQEVIIKTKELSTEERTEVFDALAVEYGLQSGKDGDLLSHSNISGTISSEMQRDALLAIVIASVVMLIYISFRFHDITTGVSAIAALLHDVLIVLAVYSIFSIPVNNSFIAAMLTIVGYSINDTIVVFDRIRENQAVMRRGDYSGLVNRSIKQTLSRSINTSLTTVAMVAMLYILGVPAIKEFAFPLMIGILSGTYSSIFIASPVWHLFKGKEEKRLAKA